MTLQLTDEGLETQTEEEILADITARLRAKFGPNTKVDATSVFGQIVLWTAEREARNQQVLLATYSSMDPNGAKGAALDARIGLTGTRRDGARRSSVKGILTFTGSGTMQNGDQIKNEDNGTLWELTNGPKSRVGAGTITDVEMTCVTTGPVLANAGTNWSVVTIVANLTGFTNPTDDAEPGADREEDPAARQRRLRELHAQGQGPLATIQGAVNKVKGVVFCRVYHNPETYPVDADGIPFKAINVVVETDPETPSGELQVAIWEAIWSALGGGGQAYGADYEGTIIDSEGRVQPVAFDVVSKKNVVMELDLVTSTTEDPITPNLEAIVAERVLDVAQDNHELVGRDVKALDYKGVVAAMLAAGEISGVDGVNVRLSFDPDVPAAVDKLSVGMRSRADFNSPDITVAQV